MLWLIPFRWLAKMVFNMNSESKLSGPGYLVLNTIRIFNIIVLLMIAVASWILIVMTVKTSSFYFFDGFTHLVTSVIAIFLIISELPIQRLKNYYEATWPVLSITHGLTFFGMSMIALGCNILGNLNKAATSVEKLGHPLWSVVISAGILSIVFGFVNIVTTFLFSDSKRGLSGRQIRAYGAAPPADKMERFNSMRSGASGSTRRTANTILPSYSAPAQATTRDTFVKRMSRFMHISKPIPIPDHTETNWDERRSPIAPNIQRPPTNLHPYHLHSDRADEDVEAVPSIPGEYRESSRPRYAASSVYSQATRI